MKRFNVDFFIFSLVLISIQGQVITWGDSRGVSSSVSPELASNTYVIYSNANAHAALKNDGSVITLGSPSQGGDSSTVRPFLSSGLYAFITN